MLNEDELMCLSILLSKIYQLDISICICPDLKSYWLQVHQLNTDILLEDKIVGHLQHALNYIYCNYAEYDDISF